MLRSIESLFVTFIALFRLSLKRLRSTPESTLGLLFGLITTVSLVSGIPAYVEAANKQVLANEIGSVATTKHPAFSFMYLYRRYPDSEVTWDDFQAADDYITRVSTPIIGLPLSSSALQLRSDNFQLFPKGTEQYEGTRRALTSMSAAVVRGIEERIDIVEGRLPEPVLGAEAVDVMMSEEIVNRLGVHVGDEFVIFRKIVVGESGEIKQFQDTVRLAGVWRATDPEEDFWFVAPSSLEESLLMPEASYVSRMIKTPKEAFSTARWYQSYNGAGVEASDVDRLLRGIGRIQTQLTNLLPGTTYPLSPHWALTRYKQTVRLQTNVLLTFSVPLLGLAWGCVVFIASLGVRQQRLEIAQLRSRGTSTRQVMVLYLLQSLFIGMFSFAIGLFGGQLVAKAISHSEGFLSFSWGETIPTTVTTSAVQMALTAIALAVLSSLLPAARWARLTIVSFKRYLARITDAPWWRRYFVDLILLAVALYGYYVLKQQGSIPFLLGGEGDPLQNPLLLLAPTLFAVAVTMVFLRLFPIIMGLLNALSRLFHGPVPVLAFGRLSRSGNYDGVLMLLILSISLSVYTASLAQTLDSNVRQRAFYRVGADMALQEMGISTGPTTMFGSSQNNTQTDDAPIVYFIPPATDALSVEGVNAATRVATFGVRAESSEKGQLLGVERLTLPQVAFFRRDFAASNLGDLMNRLAGSWENCIVSESYLSAHGLSVGDTISLRVNNAENTRLLLKIAGSVRLFPTIYPAEDDPAALFVLANIDYVEDALGYPLTGQLWLTVDPEADSEELQAGIKELGFRFSAVDNALQQIRVEEGRLERVGLFGFLSVGFSMISFLSVMSLMIHTLLSVRQQIIQFGLLRAIGLASRQLLGIFVIEQFMVVVLAMLAGAAAGITMSYLFLPFLQVGYAETLPLPPLLVAIAWSDVWRVYGIVGVAMVIVVIGMIRPLKRIRMFEAIKMGEAQSL